MDRIGMDEGMMLDGVTSKYFSCLDKTGSGVMEKVTLEGAIEIIA